MREIGQNIDVSKQSVQNLVGVPVIIKTNPSRGKSTILKGEITHLFPAVFTVTLDNGETRTFSYSDILTKSICIIKNN